MALISRRRVLRAGAAGAVLTAAPLAGDRAFAVGPLPVRYDATSPKGKAMLRIMAEAVGKMAAMSKEDEGNPRGWLFQFYTHFVSPNLTKEEELKRVFGSTSSSRKTLAEAMWSSCQAHGGQREDYFLPWHRMYILYLEEITRHLTGRFDFTMPYWNYTGPKSEDRIMPEEFRSPDDPVLKSLYRANRNPGVNSGEPIDGPSDRSRIHHDCLKSALYSDITVPMNTADDAETTIAGFCSNIDNNPHGAVHDDVGDNEGMGAVKWAANDPIFWLHHCTIDRIWASWNRAGGANPSDKEFLNKSFTFVRGDGRRVDKPIREVLDLAQVGHTYDSFIPRPADSVPFPPSPGEKLAFHVHALSTLSGICTADALPQDPIILGSLARAVPLIIAPVSGAPAEAAPDAAKRDFAAGLRGAGGGTPYYLTLVDIRVEGEAARSYDVFLAPLSSAPTRQDISYVGSINFFNAQMKMTPEDHVHGGGNAATARRTYTLVVTEAVAKLKAQGRLTAVPKVLLVPNGRGGAALPTIGGISLISA